MTALVHHGADTPRRDTVPSAPPVGATDAVVRIDTTTPCGTDLHLLTTGAPTVTDGRMVGSEAVGTVVQVGSAVTVHVGDRLLVSCSSARGHSRSRLHPCRLVPEADGQSSHATSSTPGWTRPPHDSARPSGASRPQPPRVSSADEPAVRS
jgi:threonine dehydrogenase-like Zn-dependent dehydrogenase